MIVFSDGRKVNYFIASGALAFDGKGWFWERLQVWLGWIKRSLFAITLKSLTLPPRKGNLRWWKPWECVRLILEGAVNKVGLTNPGFYKWLKKTAPKLDFKSQNIIISLFGTLEEILEMVAHLNGAQFKGLLAIELNVSCPNTGHAKDAADAVIATVKTIREKTDHDLILKISADQDGVAIAKELVGVIVAISFNTLAFSKVFPDRRSPLHRLEKRVGGGGGGVSGRPLQAHNWPFMKSIHDAVPEMQLIASSIMEFSDIDRAKSYGASAFSFGTIHLPYHKWWLKPWTIFTNPCKATRIVKRDMRQRMVQEGVDEIVLAMRR